MTNVAQDATKLPSAEIGCYYLPKPELSLGNRSRLGGRYAVHNYLAARSWHARRQQGDVTSAVNRPLE
jgi:hypothetical protein